MTTPVRTLEIADQRARIGTRADGTCYVHPTAELGPYARSMTDKLEHWAQAAPDRILFSERAPDGGRRNLTFRDAWSQAQALAAAFLARGLSPERPIAVLSGNGIDHALIALGAMTAGVPYTPISPPYSLLKGGREKLKSICDRVTPGLVFAVDATPHAAAILDAAPGDVEIVAVRGDVRGRKVTAFADLLSTRVGPEVVVAHGKISGDTIAKFLFTSGSTGSPKGVVNTQRMMCSSQAMLGQWLPSLAKEPPVIVDWLPWSHTFAGNQNFNMAVHYGGSLHIDAGRPLPGEIEETVRVLRAISPTMYFNVPKGFEELIPFLRTDAALRENFFRELKMMFYAGASLPTRIGRDLDEIALAHCGERIQMTTGLGSTETAPAAMCMSTAMSEPGNVGLPLPGVTLKLVPNNGKLEARVKGPTIMPGYWRDPERTRDAFDEEGFYKFGDALRFVDAGDVNRGFYFDGRVGEDFKLVTGTWVSVGPLRMKLIAACAPLVKDVVIAGHDQDDVTAMIFPDLDACAALAPEAAGNPRALLHAVAVRQAFAQGLAALSADARGSSGRVARLLLLEEPPSLEAHEITDKGSINQRAVLTRRAAEVARLYAATVDAEVIVG